MKRILFPLLFVAASAVWCQTSFAQRQQAVGAGIIPLDATGQLNGVDMSASAITGTLSVGIPGGPPTDIFTLNNPLVPGSLAVSTGASSQGNITFNISSSVFGNIGVTQPGGPCLLNIGAGASGTTVNFLGSVFATTLDVPGAGVVNFNSGATNITATNFAGDGTITLAPNTTAIGALTTTAGANTGTLELGSGSVLDGAVGGANGLKAINVFGGSDLAGVTATITGAVDAFSFSLGTNTLNIDGALTIANSGPAGVINTTLASPSVYGNIRPIGATNIGPTLLINVTVPSTAFIPVGTLFNIVQTRTGTLQSGTTGTRVTALNPINPLYTFSAVPTVAGTVAIPGLAARQMAGTGLPSAQLSDDIPLVTIQTTAIPLLVPLIPPSGVPLPATLPIAAKVVPVLLAVAPTPDLVSVLAPINAFSDPTPVVNAVAQLSPSAPDLVAPLLTFQVTRQFQNLWLSHLDEVLCSQVSPQDKKTSSCRENDPSKGWWLNSFGYFGNQETQGAFAGYDSKIIGTMIAYDAPLGRDTRAGLGVGYARSLIEGMTFESDTDINAYQATVYIGHEPGPWYVNGDLSFGWNDYSGMRHISFPGVNRRSNAEYSGQDYTGFVTTGYHFFTQGFTITPLASLQYTYLDLNDYRETGAGDINLSVQSQRYDFLESGLGVEVARPYDYRGGTYIPKVHFKWFRELLNPTLENTAAFTVAGSPSFTTPGLETADDTLNVGGGLTLLSGPWSLEAVYDYEQRNDSYSAHQGIVKLAHKF